MAVIEHFGQKQLGIVRFGKARINRAEALSLFGLGPIRAFGKHPNDERHFLEYVLRFVQRGHVARGRRSLLPLLTLLESR